MMQVELDAVENTIKEKKVATKTKKKAGTKKPVTEATKKKMAAAARKRPRNKDGSFRKGSAAKASGKKKKRTTAAPNAAKKRPTTRRPKKRTTTAAPNATRAVGKKKRSPAKKKQYRKVGVKRNVVGITPAEIVVFIIWGVLGWILTRFAADAATTIARKAGIMKANPTGSAAIAQENENMLRIIRIVTRGVVLVVAVMIVLRMKSDSARDSRKRAMGMGIMTGVGMATVLATMEDLTTMAFRGVQDSDTKTLMKVLFRSDQNIPDSLMVDAESNPLLIGPAQSKRNGSGAYLRGNTRTTGTTFAARDRTQGVRGLLPGTQSDDAGSHALARKIAGDMGSPGQVLPDTSGNTSRSRGAEADIKRVLAKTAGNYMLGGAVPSMSRGFTG